jgi:hypothetical protein
MNPWLLFGALVAMAVLGRVIGWWQHRHDFTEGYEAGAAITSPVADPDQDDDATVQWVKDLKEPAALELDDADAELYALAEAAVARAIGMGL